MGSNKSLKELSLLEVEANPEVYEEMQVVAPPTIRSQALRRRTAARTIQKAWNTHLKELHPTDRLIKDYYSRCRKNPNEPWIYLPHDFTHANPMFNHEFDGPAHNTRLLRGEGRRPPRNLRLKSRQVQRILPYAEATDRRNWTGLNPNGRPSWAPLRKLTNFPSRKKSKKKKVCKLKSSIRGKLKTSKKYPSHLFQRNGKVWLKSSKNKKNNKNPIYCTCNVFLKKNPRYSQCKYHPSTEPYHEYNHKILYEVFHDKKIPKGMQVDHINNNSKDNRLRNLRLLTKNQNMQKRRSKKNGKSKYKGVTFNKESKKKPWKARINYNNIQKYLGTFETELEAYQAYKREARKLNKTMNTKFMD